ncbi:HAMP domain-containing sensor histidine kinase [Actinomycetaceae bacterium MB13-C1-2]|nr:HAMP domain-containing sensor histidine kinase [Actinomycetaceae bacterium MB13-C1-2]
MSPRKARLTIRGRLTLAFSVIFALVGTLMVVATYFFMRYVPHYGLMREVGTVVSFETEELSPLSIVRTPDDDAIQSEWSTFVIQDATTLLNVQLLISLVFLVVLICAGAVASWFIAGRILQPINTLSQVAKDASEGNLKQRVELDGPDDEVRRLGATFDHMLTRLDAAFESHKRFAAGASHQLQTPLAATRTMIDVASSDPSPSVEGLQETLSRVRQMNERSIETVDALLDLTAIEYRSDNVEEVDLGVLVGGALSVVAAESADRGITITSDIAPDSRTFANPVLIEQMLVNLLQNAVRHNHDGGSIEVRLTADTCPKLHISNTGEKVDPARVEQLTEPFSRGRDQAAKTGHGLGLAIVQSIADASNARLTLESNPEGGLCVTVTF